MNFTPFTNQFTGSIPAGAVHQFTTAKFAQNITTANGGQMGQVVGVLSGGEGGVHYLRPVDSGGTFQHQQQQLITLPITVPGAKPGDPQQTVQIQVMNPNVTGLTTQNAIQQPKYQMAQIPIQTFQQGELGTTVLTVAYTQQDGSEGVQILGNTGLPEGIQVVAALQPQDVQQMLAHLPNNEMSGGKNPGDCSTTQGISLGALLPTQQVANLIEDKKNVLNNNNNIATNFRIKQECVSIDDQGNIEVSPQSPQWTIAPTVELAEYFSRISGSGQLPVSLQQFLRFNPDMYSIKREMALGLEAESGGSRQQERTDEGVDVEREGRNEEVKEGNTDNIQQVDVSQEGEAPKTKKKKKYKKKPPKPKKPKPGQVVIATALDGTTLYCCPECHMAYPDKDLLEQHLVGHKIERRYICGICGAGLKRREHLERHKLGHNPDRPFVCSVCLKGFKRKEHLNLHYVIHSGEKTEICQECGKGFYRKDHLRKHARSHAARRAREEQQMLQLQTHPGTQHSQQVSPQNQQQNQVSISNTSQVRNNQDSIGTIQPEITIHVKVPTSSIPVPVQISVPHHIVSMASGNISGGNQHSISIKPEMEEMLLQQLVSRTNNTDQQS